MGKPSIVFSDAIFGSTKELAGSTADDRRVFANVELSQIIARAMDSARILSVNATPADRAQCYTLMEAELEEWRETWLPKIQLGGLDGKDVLTHALCVL
jgi:hypothetical protein